MLKNSVRALVAGIGFLGVFSLPVQSFAQAFNPPANTFAYGPAWTATGPTTNQSGSYAASLTSGTMAAGLAANSPIFSFRYTGTGYAVVRRVLISAGDTVGFAAGTATFQMFAARSFTASDTGGTAATLTGNNAKLRTSFATTGVGQIMIATTATNSAGTRTLDATPVGSIAISAPTTGSGGFVSPTNLMGPNEAGLYPVVAAQNEGFVIQATVPATGTWTISVIVVWDEYPAF